MALNTAYLKFETVSSGTMFFIWSKTPVEGALCYFETTEPVQGFKYSQNSGRTELVRNCQSDRTSVFTAWCEFVKIAKKYNGSIKVLEHSTPFNIKLVLHMSNNNLVVLDRGQLYSLADADAVASLHKDSSVLDTKTMVIKLFQGKATESRGGCICFD